MALLVVLAALTWPAMTRPLAIQRLRKAAEQVRADLVRARVKAMSNGQTYVFRWLPDADRYSLQPADSGETAMEDSASGAGAIDVDLSTNGEQPATATTIERSLPEGITFQGESDEQQRAVSMLGTTDGLGDLGGGATFEAGGSNAEIRFAPDGTTSTARLSLKNAYGRSIEVHLRGLTGTVTVGDVQTTSETPSNVEPQPGVNAQPSGEVNQP